MAFYDQDIPAWMNPARNVMETQREATPSIGHNFAAAFMQQQSNKTDYAKMQVEALKQRIDMNALSIQQEGQAQTEVSEWMKASGGDPIWMVNHPYTGTNPKAASEIGSTQIRAGESLTVRQSQQDLMDFGKRLSTLQPGARAAIRDLPNDPKTGLPTADKWQQLEIAESSEALQRQNLRDEAEAQARAAGITPKTTISPKGVTQTFTPTKPGEQAMGEAEVKEFPDGSKLIHVSPKRWQYVKGDKQQEMSSNQLMQLSKSFKEMDPDDATAKLIDDALRSEAITQVTKPKAPASTQPKTKDHILPDKVTAPPSSGKVRVISPDGTAGFIPADQVEQAKAQGYKLAPQ